MFNFRTAENSSRGRDIWREVRGGTVVSPSEGVDFLGVNIDGAVTASYLLYE